MAGVVHGTQAKRRELTDKLMTALIVGVSVLAAVALVVPTISMVGHALSSPWRGLGMVALLLTGASVTVRALMRRSALRKATNGRKH